MKERRKGLIVLLTTAVLLTALTALLAYGLNIGKEDTPGLFSLSHIQLGLDLKGGVYVVYEADKANPDLEEMRTAENLIRNRLDRMGSTEATVSIQGTNRLRVEIPGTENPDQAVKDIGQTAMLTFEDEDGAVLVSGAEVVNASAHSGQLSQNGPMEVFITLKFTDTGSKQFAEATANNIGRSILIKLDDAVLSAPMVSTAITNGEAMITGNFEPKEAEQLAVLIRSGALPFKLNVVEMNVIGAQLGADALQGSILAGIIGFAIVFVFMLVIYRLSGLAADIALLFFIVLELLILSIFGITLTLPGIAGIILTIGMAVDANVIIFERIYEEITAGKSLKYAVKSGYKRALPAIMDGNITTLIAAIILFWFGTGPIRGFAQTLMLGIIISIFSAVVITRVIMNAIFSIGIKNKNLFSRKGVKIIENH